MENTVKATTTVPLPTASMGVLSNPVATPQPLVLDLDSSNEPPTGPITEGEALGTVIDRSISTDASPLQRPFGTNTDNGNHTTGLRLNKEQGPERTPPENQVSSLIFMFYILCVTVMMMFCYAVMLSMRDAEEGIFVFVYLKTVLKVLIYLHILFLLSHSF